MRTLGDSGAETRGMNLLATLVLLRPQSLTGANPSILNLFARLVQACLPCSVDSVHHVSCYYIYFHVRAAVAGEVNGNLCMTKSYLFFVVPSYVSKLTGLNVRV